MNKLYISKALYLVKAKPTELGFVHPKTNELLVSTPYAYSYRSFPHGKYRKGTRLEDKPEFIEYEDVLEKEKNIINSNETDENNESAVNNETDESTVNNDILESGMLDDGSDIIDDGSDITFEE